MIDSHDFLSSAMSYYVPRNGDWKTRSDPPDPPYIEVDEMAHSVRFVGGPDSNVELSGAPARSDTETVHTVMILAPDLTEGTTLCALRAEDNDLTVEDRRPPDARTRFADAFEQLQAAMDEILIPVYIDDAIDELSESVDGLVAIHTAQYTEVPQKDCTYFRTAAFREGRLLYEAERGEL